MNMNQLFRDAQSDPSLFARLNIEELLDSTKHDYLENETVTSITQSVFENIASLSISKEQTVDYCRKLVGYRFVDEIYQLHKGKHVRWIRTSAPDKLLVGGIVVDIRFADEGVNVLCRLPNGRFMQYRFDQCLTFQKLTDDEQLVLSISSSIHWEYIFWTNPEICILPTPYD